jgi:hypothetical protein
MSLYLSERMRRTISPRHSAAAAAGTVGPPGSAARKGCAWCCRAALHHARSRRFAKMICAVHARTQTQPCQRCCVAAAGCPRVTITSRARGQCTHCRGGACTTHDARRHGTPARQIPRAAGAATARPRVDASRQAPQGTAAHTPARMSAPPPPPSLPHARRTCSDGCVQLWQEKELPWLATRARDCRRTAVDGTADSSNAVW